MSTPSNFHAGAGEPPAPGASYAAAYAAAYVGPDVRDLESVDRSDQLAQSAAPAVALPAWLGQFNHLPPPSRKEAEVSLAAFLSVIGVALSLTAPFHGVMLLFAPLALTLATWSLAHWGETPVPREFRWLALAAVVMGGLWLGVWAVHLALALA